MMAVDNTSFMEDQDSKRWFIDSGATRHMSPMRECMTEYQVFSQP